MSNPGNGLDLTLRTEAERKIAQPRLWPGGYSRFQCAQKRSIGIASLTLAAAASTRDNLLPQWTRSPQSILSRLIIAIVSTLCISGCATSSMRVSVESDAAADAERLKSYILINGPGFANDPLLAAHVAPYVKAALAKQGFYEAPNPKQAQISILMHYHLLNPMSFTHDSVVRGQIGGGISQFNATSYGSTGPVTTSGTVYQEPQYGVVGTERHTNTYFPVSFFLQTRKYQTFVRTGTLGPPVWTTFAAVALQGEEGAGGVRVVIAKLIDAMTPYIGRDTGGMQHVNVQLD